MAFVFKDEEPKPLESTGRYSFKDETPPVSTEAKEEAPFKATHPNLYGIWGAAKETVKTMVPYLKYVDPEEREKFMKMSQQEQTRDLLLQNLEAVGELGTAPILKGLKPILQLHFPKTHKLLTKGFGKPKDVFEPLSGADEVTAMYDRATEASKNLHRKTISQLYSEFKLKTIDVSGNVKAKLLKQGDAGKEVVMRHDLIAGAKSKALQDIDLASKNIFGGLSGAEQESLNRVIQSRRTIAIENYKQIKHPEALGAEKHQEFLSSFPEDVATKLNAKADAYFGVMKKQLDSLLDEGIISKEVHSALVASGDYSPRNFLQHIDPDKTYTFGGKKITVPDSGIQRLDEGSIGLLEKDAPALLSQVVARTQGRIFRNRANKALYNLASEFPDNGIVSLSKVTSKTKTGKLVYQKAPAGHEKVSVMIDGHPREMVMPKEFAKEWVMRDPEIGAQLANIIGWLSGNKILKPMATGLNPEFALTNFPRDIAHIWLTTQEYSGVMPKAALQMGKDLAVVAKDALFRTGRWNDYINEGGGMEFLTHQGRTSKGTGVLSKIEKVMGYMGESSEMITRLALRERALKNGAAPEMATWIARNYLDFSQGGSYAKALDSGIPYLNAAIQGTRGVFRAAAQKPGTFIFKTSQIGTLAIGLYMANRTQNPEAWAQVSSREKVNNFIITTPFSYKDKDGTKRYIYFKIAKDQGQRAIASVFENLMAKFMGDKVDADQISQAVQDALPLIPTETLPPSVDAILGYGANKDFWLRKDIWRGPDIESKEEHTAYTHPAFVAAGEKTGLSPERLKYALSQYFTRGNIYTSMAGYAWNKVFEGASEEDKNKVTQEIILNKPFIRRIVNETDPYHQFEKGMKAADKKASTEKYVLTRDFDALSNQFYNKGGTTKKDIHSFIKNVPVTEKNRLWERHFRRGRIQELPDKRWWLNLAGMKNPEAKAISYWNRWLESTPEQKKELESNLKKVPGILGEKFSVKLKQLRKENKE